MNRLNTLATKYDFDLNYKDGIIEIKPKFKFLKKENIGLILMIIIPTSLALLIISKMEHVNIFMLILSGLLIIIPIISLTTIFKTFNDKVIIKDNKIEFINSLISKSFKLSQDLKFVLKTENIVFDLKLATGYYTIIDLYVVSDENEYRFLDISSESQNFSEITELGYLIIEEMKKACNNA